MYSLAKAKKKNTLKEIRSQITAPQTLYATYISRKVSVYISSFLVKHTDVTANQVTFSSMIFGILSGVALFFQNYISAFIFFNLYYISDSVDGEVARFRKQTSVKGEYLDLVSHYVVTPVIIGGLFLGLYRYYNELFILFLCLIAVTTKMMIFASRESMEKLKIELKTKKTPLISSGIKCLYGLVFLNIVLVFSICISFVFGIEIQYLLYRYILFYGSTYPLIFIYDQVKTFKSIKTNA